MAVVNIDLSEYDMLREAKLKAEKTIEKLEQEMKDLKSSSKIILRREHTYLAPMWDERDLEYELQNRLRHFINYRTCESVFDRYDEIGIKQLSAALESSFKAIRKQYKPVHPSTLKEETLPERSDTLIGFEDIRLNVENLIKEEYNGKLESQLEDLRRQQEKLKAKEKSIREELRGDFLERIEESKKELKDALQENKELTAKIADLKAQIKGLSMSNEEKLSIALKNLEEAKKEVERLKAKRRWSLFKR